MEHGILRGCGDAGAAASIEMQGFFERAAKDLNEIYKMAMECEEILTAMRDRLSGGAGVTCGGEAVEEPTPNDGEIGSMHRRHEILKFELFRMFDTINELNRRL